MRTTMVATLALLMAPAILSADQASRLDPEPAIAIDPVAVAPEAWSRQDPADSLYRAAREAMNRGEYLTAASLFRQVWQRHARSAYAPDAPYWEAFSLYRTDETDRLERALEVLAVQRERYARAPTLENGDARALEARIRGILARRGDERSARELVVAMNELAALGPIISEEVAAQMSMMAEVMAQQGRAIADQVQIVAEQGVAIGRSFAGVGSDVPEQCREEAETQLAALNALMHMNADRAIPVLKQVMQRRDECSLPLRRRALFLVADQESPETVEILLDAARNDPDLEVRRQAVFWLSEVEDDRAIDALDQFLRSSDDEQIRERAIFALSQHDSPRARQILRRVAGDGAMPARLRSRAVIWLAHEGDRQDLEFLKGLFGRGDATQDRSILTAVGQAGRSEDARWLLSIAENPRVDAELRRTAVFWASEAGAAPNDLGSLYQRVEDRAMKERILFALSQSDRPGAVDRLIDIARTERDPQLRTRAIFWLGNSNDPRAADVLAELISSPPREHR